MLNVKNIFFDGGGYSGPFDEFLASFPHAPHPLLVRLIRIKRLQAAIRESLSETTMAAMFGVDVKTIAAWKKEAECCSNGELRLLELDLIGILIEGLSKGDSISLEDVRKRILGAYARLNHGSYFCSKDDVLAGLMKHACDRGLFDKFRKSRRTLYQYTGESLRYPKAESLTAKVARSERANRILVQTREEDVDCIELKLNYVGASLVLSQIFDSGKLLPCLEKFIREEEPQAVNRTRVKGLPVTFNHGCLFALALKPVDTRDSLSKRELVSWAVTHSVEDKSELLPLDMHLDETGCRKFKKMLADFVKEIMATKEAAEAVKEGPGNGAKFEFTLSFCYAKLL